MPHAWAYIFPSLVANKVFGEALNVLSVPCEGRTSQFDARTGLGVGPIFPMLYATENEVLDLNIDKTFLEYMANSAINI